MPAPKDPRIDIMQLMQQGRFAMMNGLITQYMNAVSANDNKQAAMLRVDLHDNLDILLDMIDGNLKKLQAGRQG